MHQPLDPNFRNELPRAYHIEWMKPGQVYAGTVTETIFPNNFCTVQLEDGRVVPGCVWCAGTLSSMLGFKTSYLPPIGTKVAIVSTGYEPTLIIGCLPSPIQDTAGHSRSTVDEDLNYHNAQTFNHARSSDSIMMANGKPPVDLVEGEIQIDNLLGVGLSLLRNMARLSGGALATVECHVQNDMVRIVSDTFRHHTAFGDVRISNDGGKLNAICHGTAHDYEAWGLRRPKDAKAAMAADCELDASQTVDGYLDDMRPRFSQYVGWLGNFIHLFVTDPVEQIGKIADGQLRSGKARLHINTDGAVLVQSVADIVLEKVVRIPVPIQIRTEDDPQGNRTDESPKSLDPLKTWVPSDTSNIFEMVFQLREYARWLNNQAAFARFRMQDRDYRVPTEAETPAPALLSSEADREEVNKGVKNNWTLAYSTIRIYRDGSIQTVDAYGNSFTSTKIGIQISSTTDILLQAAGAINLVAGRSINLLARESIGISAITGGLWLRAKEKFQMLCETGNMLIDTMKGVLKVKGTFNVEDMLSVDKSGTNVIGMLTASMVAAEVTLPNGEGPHMQHLFPGTPKVTEVVEDFAYPNSYAGAPLYETMAQQALKTGEHTSSGDWKFSDNAIPGKGSPWPGPGITHRTASTSETLQTPSDRSSFGPTPKQVEHGKPITMKYV